MRANEESSERQISQNRGGGIRQLANFHWPFPFTQTLLFLLSSLLSSLALSPLPGEGASVLHNGRVVFGPGGGGSSRAGTEVSFLFSILTKPPPLFPNLPSSTLPSPRHPYTLAVPISPGGSCQSSASLRIPLELIVPAVAGGGKRSEAAAGRRWRVRCQSLSLIINFCHSAPWQPRSLAPPPSFSLFLPLSLWLLSPRVSWFGMPSLRRRVQPFIMCHTHTVLSPRSLPLTPCLVLIVFYLAPPTKPFAPFDLHPIPPLDSPHRTSSLFHCPIPPSL